MPRDWALQLCERFHLSLPPDVAMWLDEELWKRADLYIPLGNPISPVDLLSPGSHRVWGGQHLPDTLPLFDDGSGNVTCLRVRGDGSVSELLLWQTDGQWQPLGESLGTTQDFTELWLSAERPRPVKFGCQRLALLRDHLEPPLLGRPYLEAALQQPSRTDDYWLEQGEHALAEGRPADAYSCFYAAGWDEFCTRDGELLDRIANAAEAAGFTALREIARCHRAHLS